MHTTHIYTYVCASKKKKKAQILKSIATNETEPQEPFTRESSKLRKPEQPFTGDLKLPASLPLHQYEPDTPHPHHICARQDCPGTKTRQPYENDFNSNKATHKSTRTRTTYTEIALDRTLRVGTCCAGDSSSCPCSPCSARGSFSPPSSSESSKSGPWSSGVRSAAKSTFSDTPRRNETRTRQPTHDRNNNPTLCEIDCFRGGRATEEDLMVLWRRWWSGRHGSVSRGIEFLSKGCCPHVEPTQK